MAIRSRFIHPDVMYQAPGGQEFPVVSRQAIETALADGAAMLDIAGGTLTIVTLRQTTGVPNEMVTVGAIMEWKDRTDAKPQAETPSLFEPTEAEGQPVLPFEHTPEGPMTTDELMGIDPRIAVESVDSPDGLDYDKLPEEDLSDVPAEVR